MAQRACSPHLTHFRSSPWLPLSMAFAALSLSVLYGAESVQYPGDFRRWVHIGTGVILPGGALPESEQGMHHTHNAVVFNFYGITLYVSTSTM